jgi:hypothetical protein
MKNLFSTIRSWFSPKQQYASEVALLRLEYESRIQHLECVIKRHSVMLKHDQVSVTTSEETLKAHFDCVVSESVMKWLANWADDLDFVKTNDIESTVSDAINEHDFSDSISDALDDAISNRDWDYELRDAIDWDKVADKVVDKIDWSDAIRTNDILTTDDIDTDDLMLKSEHMSEDDLVTRDDLSDMVIGELKRDWFTQMLKDDVARIFKDTLQSVRDTEDANCRNAIDDEIVAKVDTLVAEQLLKKFGDSFDIWFHNLIAHSVKHVITQMITAAHDQVVSDSEESKS